MPAEPTNTQLMGAITGFRNDIRTEMLEFRDEILDAMGTFSESVDRRFDAVETRLTRVESQMVTKSYLDDKLADEGALMGGNVRETNLKIHALTNKLVSAKSLSASAARSVTLMPPFARRSSSP